ncbi:MAG: hypothetical protein EA341_01000 [Mongoliibacter sp.]|nr:MAG: hypothetical protein EA341_01000 [Mongoliibacter sp.]
MGRVILFSLGNAYITETNGRKQVILHNYRLGDVNLITKISKKNFYAYNISFCTDNNRFDNISYY